jgi:hypothetical protein
MTEIAMDAFPLDSGLLIGSAFEAGQETMEPILNPRTGGLILEVAEASAGQVDRAVEAARRAFAGWSRTTPAERAAALLRIADRIEAEADAFAALEALNCGKPINAARGDEIPAITDCYRFFAGAVRTQHGQAAGEYLAGHTSMIRRDAIGVVASIAPWNYPLMMMAWKLAPAIAGGNTVVFKPSEQTPLTALKMARLLAEVLPEGVVNVVTGRGQTVGNHLIHHPGIDMISLTGDVATGRKMLDAAAKTVKRTHLELGGKAPVIVFDDADVAAVVEGLRAFSFYNAGQDCTAACRVYAGRKIYDRLVADLTSATASITLGAEDDTTNEIGPLSPGDPAGRQRSVGSAGQLRLCPGEERPPIAFQLLRADAGDPGHLVQRHGPLLGHLDQRAVGEDDIGGHGRRLGQRAALGLQRRQSSGASSSATMVRMAGLGRGRTTVSLRSSHRRLARRTGRAASVIRSAPCVRDRGGPGRGPSSAGRHRPQAALDRSRPTPKVGSWSCPVRAPSVACRSGCRSDAPPRTTRRPQDRRQRLPHRIGGIEEHRRAVAKIAVAAGRGTLRRNSQAAPGGGRPDRLGQPQKRVQPGVVGLPCGRRGGALVDLLRRRRMSSGP